MLEPNGPVSGHDQIKMASSILDYIMRDLAINYLDRQGPSLMSRLLMTTSAETPSNPMPNPQTTKHGKNLHRSTPWPRTQQRH